ncbi:GTP pyrophosphokinase [Eubacterium oxidoreducens]|uniref:Putative GTP pyrophosphokinase n=1 Tax=Eubacterium oxidoreducens TaxID=1732 RepID=A0A1G6A043_EUBOX|nr:GTP pyrophosphokinase family protein [Eubacterium oxidoreducens]SDB01626.1 putative GTP pyrophosphokinase [Eubacterium oxidoreducens]
MEELNIDEYIEYDNKQNEDQTDTDLTTLVSFTNYDVVLNTSMQLQQLMVMYEAGIDHIQTKLEILNKEFEVKKNRNPIASISSRVKEPMSIMEKLQRKGYPVTMENLMTKIFDIAGVRITCPFISDIYDVANILLSHDDIHLIELKDYIKYPKENGYRSLHLVVDVEVFFSEQKKRIPVEIQIRTIAMDFWAALEHQMAYKQGFEIPAEIYNELRDCATVIANTDERMQRIANILPSFDKDASYNIIDS